MIFKSHLNYLFIAFEKKILRKVCCERREINQFDCETTFLMMAKKQVDGDEKQFSHDAN